MRRSIQPAATLALVLMLSGCVAAAAVPVVVSGVAANKMIKTTKAKAAKREQAPVQPIAAKPLPADLSQMQPGQAYVGALPRPATVMSGALPPPSAAVPVVADPTPVVAATPVSAPAFAPPGQQGWAEVVRFVAGGMSAGAEHGALLARGSTAPNPRWAACDGKPSAVVTPLALIRAKDKSWIEALMVMGARLVVIGTADDRKAAAATFTRAGLPGPADDALIEASGAADMPAARAKVAERFCVLAVAGREASDFPNGYLPATTPAALANEWGAGWFLFAR